MSMGVCTYIRVYVDVMRHIGPEDQSYCRMEA